MQIKENVTNMEIKKTSNSILGYIKSISKLLPYSESQKAPVLLELQEDVRIAMESSDKRPPSVVFGVPTEVARNISISYDWGTTPARWTIRVLASIIDFSIIIGLFVFFGFTRIILSDFQLDALKWHDLNIPFGFFFISIPIFGFILVYFIVCEYVYSTTIGKKILGLLVVDESGIKITWTQSFIRNITKVPFLTSFLLFDFFLGILSEKTRGRQQRVLDFIAGTIVVKQSKNIR